MHNKRIFVSGGAGTIGTILVQRLLEEGADVFVGDLRPCPKAWMGKVKYRQGDLNFIAPSELITFDPEIYFHLAAPFERKEESYQFFEDNFHHNLKLSHYLLHSFQNVRSLNRIVFASSYFIYDPSLYLFHEPPKQAAILTENSPIYPYNLYGASKLFHELELRFLNHFLNHQISCVSARVFRVYGSDSHSIISQWIRSALRHEPITINHPEEMLDYIFANDVAEGLLRLAVIDYQGVVNLGCGQARATSEIIKILKQFFPELHINHQSSSAPFEASQASLDRLKSLTNWQPSHSLEMAIPKMIASEREMGQEHSTAHEHRAVLITSISKKMSLIEAVRTAANQLGQFQEIHGCDSQSSCIGQYGVDKFWHCPSLEQMTWEDIVTYCRENKITSIIPTRNADLEFYAQHRSAFQKRGIYPMVSSLETISSCLDKKKFADLLWQHHFPVIPTYLSLEEFHSPAYVVKERKGAGSQQLGLGLTREEALEHGCKLKEPIFQPFIEGMEWSIDMYRSFEGRVKGCVARQRNVVVNGESQVTTTFHYPSLEKICHEMADLLNIQGHAVFQIIEDKSGKFHVIECNPRFGGASTASIAVGLESFLWFFIECLGLDLHDYPFMRCKGEIRQVRYLTDRLLPWSSYLT